MDRAPSTIDPDAVDALVVDLDGTLYAGTDVWFEAYASEVAGRGDVDAEVVRREVEAVLGGHRALRLGDFYDSERKVVVRADDWHPSHALTWDGATADLPGELDGERPLQWATRLLYVGDAFQAFGAVAAHLGVAGSDRDAAFAAIRRRMLEDHTTTAPTVGAADLARAYPHASLRVLATNTPAELSADLVARLGMAAFFDEVRYGAKKPQGLVALLEEVIARVGCEPHRVLCIGDSYWNDVLPALAAGCRAVWVDTHDSGAHEGVPRVVTLADLCAE
jgi:FMN phosphatase YigB (HAD superfamily)